MQFNFTWDASVANAPSAFKAAVIAAGQTLASYFTDNITINIAVGWGETGGIAVPSNALSTGNDVGTQVTNGTQMSFSQVTQNLVKTTTSGDDTTSTQYLTSISDPTNGGKIYVGSALQKAWGLLPGSSTALDGVIGFNSSTAWTFDPSNGVAPGTNDFLGAALHELTHAMGRIREAVSTPAYRGVLDLFAFSSASTLQLPTNSSKTAYFSADGGQTLLNPFSGPGGDMADWAAPQTDPFTGGLLGSVQPISATDLRTMDVLGYTLSTAGNLIAHSITSNTQNGNVTGDANDNIITLGGGTATVKGGAGNDVITGLAGAWHASVNYTIGGLSNVFYDDTSGHFYQIVNFSNPATTWTQASAAAASETLFGATGHLVTITSAQQESAIQAAMQSLGYDGGSLTSSAYTIGYIGLTKINGTWQWQGNTSLTYSDWVTGDPTSVATDSVGAIVNGGANFSTVWFNVNPSANPYQNNAGVQVLGIVEFDPANPPPYTSPTVYTSVYSGTISQYKITSSGGAITVADSVAGRDGSDTLSNIQQAKFSDVTLVFDLTSAEDKLVYELYQAAYARTPDNSGYRYWATQGDATSMSATSLADAFLSAPEFTQKYGSNPSNATYVTALYSNVLGRIPDAAGLTYWIGLANAGMAKDALLVNFATSQENVNLIAPHVSNGFWTI